MKLHSPQLVSLSEASLLHALMSETRRPNLLVVCRRVTVEAAARHVVSYCQPPFHMVALPGLLNLDEIKQYVASGDLILLEATFLTGAYGFQDAKKEGRANLRSRKEFDSLLDIQLARTADPAVTPLPIVNE